MNTHHNLSLNTHTTTSNGQEREEIPTRLEEVNLEDISIHFLCTYSTDPNQKQIVSTCNDYGQTLAHIAVTLGYFRLLQHLFKWEIDLNVVDSMGLSALHYAYLFKQEACAKFLIHSGVDRFILDDLGRSPADLDPSLEVRLGSIMDIDSDNSVNGAPPIEYDTEMPDEAEKLFAKHFLTQQWRGVSEDERRGEMSLSRFQSQKTSSPPALDSSSLVVHTPEGHPTPVVAEEIGLEALIETTTPTRIIHPPSLISEISSQAQESNSPTDTSQHPFSPLGGVITTPGLDDAPIYRGITDSGIIDFPRLARRELSVDWTTRQGRLLISNTPEDIKERNGAKGEELLQQSSSSPVSTRLARQRNISSSSGDAASPDTACSETFEHTDPPRIHTNARRGMLNSSSAAAHAVGRSARTGVGRTRLRRRGVMSVGTSGGVTVERKLSVSGETTVVTAASGGSDGVSIGGISPTGKRQTQCTNCKTTTTPPWRRDPQGQPLCSVCFVSVSLNVSSGIILTLVFRNSTLGLYPS